MSYGDIMLKSDIYLSCPTSKGKKRDLEDIVSEAIKKEIDVLSIVDSIEENNGILITTYLCDPTSSRRGEISNLQKLRKEITLLNGIQVSNPHLREKELNLYATFPMDVITGIVPNICFHLEHEEEIQKAYEDYYLRNLYAVQKGNIDVLAQLGSVHTHYGYAYHNYALIDTLLNQLVDKEIALEVTSGIKRKDAFTTIPSYPILKRYKELGGENVVVGSCIRNALGRNLEDVYKVVQDLDLNPGYFQKRKFKKIL